MAERSQAAVELYNQGQYEEANRLIANALAEGETSELWNDWGMVQHALGDRQAAEKGFRRALELDKAYTVAGVNLGILLVALGRLAEASPWLERALPELPEPDRSRVAAILEDCYRQLGAQQGVKDPHPDARVPGSPISILVVHEMLPQPDRSGSDVRVVQVVREARAQGHQVTFVARNGTLREEYGPPLQALGVAVWAHDAERLRFLGIDAPADWTFENLLRQNRFDLAILFHWFWSGISVPEHYMDEIRRLSPATRIVVISEDQHGLRELRMAKLSGLWSDYERAQNYADREIEVYRRADLVRVISEEDKRGLVSRAPELNIEVLPMIADVAPLGSGFAERSDLLFVGNFDNLANRDGVEWMLAEVWPRVRRQLPGAVITLAGNNLPSEPGVGQDGTRRVGHVPDLEPLFAHHRVFVSPVRFGTGIKTKNLGALTHGLPLVTSTGGAEGLNLIDGTHALIADSPEDFAEAIVRAYTDERLWQKLSREGQRLIVEQFGAKRLQAALDHLIRQAGSLRPRSFDRGYTCSYLRVEQRYPELLNWKPGYHRPLLRLLGYVGLAEEYLNGSQPSAALEQLRHLFSNARLSANPLFLHALTLMARCYRELGDSDKASAYEQGCQQSAETANRSLPGPLVRRSGGRAPCPDGRVDLSVILPTCNRRDTLRACLAYLALQSLATRRWEVVVVDDGSTDGTEELCRTFSKFYRLRYVRQENAGAGAARRAAVKQAHGEYVLFINDDTMASHDLLAEHLRIQHQHRGEKVSVLGDFQYPPEAKNRALTFFLRVSPFLFPQVSMKPGLYTDPAYFITCNLSVRRKAVLAAGSFDPRFHVAEDTELGVRLRSAGYQVLYHPKARALHDHLDFAVADLVRRAQIYGRIQPLLFRKHPQLLGDGTGPFGRLDRASIERIRRRVEEERADITSVLTALHKFDSVDFSGYFDMKRGQRTAAEEIMEMFAKAVPAVFWFHRFESFLEAWSGDMEQ